MIKDYLKISYRKATKPPRYADLEKALAPLAQDIAFRFSYKGTPHLLTEVNNVVYSVCYFGGHDSWRVFYPYQHPEQGSRDFSSIPEVAEFLQQQVTNYQRGNKKRREL